MQKGLRGREGGVGGVGYTTLHYTTLHYTTLRVRALELVSVRQFGLLPPLSCGLEDLQPAKLFGGAAVGSTTTNKANIIIAALEKAQASAKQ